MKDMIPSFLKDVYNAAQEQVEKDYMALCLADEEYVRVEWMSIHCSDSPHFDTDVPAEFARDLLILHAIDKNFSLPSLCLLLVHVFLESCSEVRVSAIPADVCA